MPPRTKSYHLLSQATKTTIFLLLLIAPAVVHSTVDDQINPYPSKSHNYSYYYDNNPATTSKSTTTTTTPSITTFQSPTPSTISFSFVDTTIDTPEGKVSFILFGYYRIKCRGFIDPADTNDFNLGDPVLTSITGSLQPNQRSVCRNAADFGFDNCGYVSVSGMPPYGVFAYTGPNCYGELAWSFSGIGGADYRPEREWLSFDFNRKTVEEVVNDI